MMYTIRGKMYNTVIIVKEMYDLHYFFERDV